MTRQRPFAEDIAIGTPTLGHVPVSAGAGAPPAWGAGGSGQKTVIPFVVSADGEYDTFINFGFVVEDWILAGDVVGDVTVDVGTATFAAYPTVTDITGGTPPALAGEQKHQGGSVAGWTTTIAANSFVCYTVSGLTGITQLRIFLLGHRT